MWSAQVDDGNVKICLEITLLFILIIIKSICYLVKVWASHALSDMARYASRLPPAFTTAIRLYVDCSLVTPSLQLP